MLALLAEAVVVLVQVVFHWLYAIWCVFIPKRPKDVSRETVLITGAGSGLGRLLALRFASQGSILVLWDINTAANEETAKKVRNIGANAQTYTVDLGNRDQIYAAADKVKNSVGQVDILINNAGVVTGRKLLESSDDKVKLTMDINIMAHFWTVKAFLPSMMSRNHGHIVTIASAAGLFGVTGLVDYCASKFAAVGLDESLRQELEYQGKTGVHTTVVCPYYINTGMFDGVKTRFPSLLPIMEPEFAVDRIMSAILTNQQVLLLPRSLYLTLALKGIIPTKCGEILGKFFGVSSTMDEFRGREKRE